MSKDPVIATISCSDDAHVPYVTRHLETQHVLIDPSLLISGTELSYRMDGRGLTVTYDGVELDCVKAVWYRKPQSFRQEFMPVELQYRRYSRSALERHWNILRNLFDSSFWVSDFYQMMRAENKAWQLQVARQVGFLVPRTLMTSSPEVAKKFVARHRPVLVKSLSSAAGYDSSDEDGVRILFATKFEASGDEDFAGLNLAPAIFQETIDAEVDIRVNVVGDEIFASSIRGSAINGTGSNVRDWSIIYFQGDHRIEPYDLPSDVADKCVRHTKALGMQFGALDLVKDRKGRYWFLENNPNGQWAFVEDQTQQPIGRAVAQLLEGR